MCETRHSRRRESRLGENVAASRISEQVGRGDLGESVTYGVALLVYCRVAKQPLHYSTAVHIYQADSRRWHRVRTIRKHASARASPFLSLSLSLLARARALTHIKRKEEEEEAKGPLPESCFLWMTFPFLSPLQLAKSTILRQKGRAR